jgi:hypothetical protein
MIDSLTTNAMAFMEHTLLPYLFKALHLLLHLICEGLELALL